MATYTLTGSGIQALSSSVVALHVTITAVPASSGHGTANPLDYYGVAEIRAGNATAFWEPWVVCGGPQWIALPYGSTRIGYAIAEDVTVSAAEVFSPAPFAFPLALLPDVALTSPSDTQVLTYQASSSKWINAAASGGTGGAVIGCRIYNSVSFSIPNNGGLVTFNNERWDTDTMHSTTTNTGRITCHTAGKYLINANVEWAGNATGVREVQFQINGSLIVGKQLIAASGGTALTQSPSTIYDLAVNDYVELFCYQNSGVAINLTRQNNWSPEFSAVRLGA